MVPPKNICKVGLYLREKGRAMASACLKAVARSVATARASGRMGRNEARFRDQGARDTLKQLRPTA